ncbi:panthothenate synthetase [candidate division KSB1 bacterium]|nr:panthothenate synthetase [candidate division KSB1 bacterium]
MRMLVDIIFPHEQFNEAVRNGTVGETMGKILADQKPEAVYFTNRGGKRSLTLIVNVDKPSDVPSIAEPWFLKFNADVQLRVVMSPEDLQNAGLDELGKKWG